MKISAAPVDREKNSPEYGAAGFFNLPLFLNAIKIFLMIIVTVNFYYDRLVI